MDWLNYFRHLRDMGLSKKTLSLAKNDVSKFYCFLNFMEINVESTTLNDLNNFIEFLKSTGLKDRVINRVINRIFDFLTFCNIQTDCAGKNASDLYLLEEKNLEALTFSNAHTFFEYLNSWRDELIFKIIYVTGASISEVLNLKITDIFNAKETEMKDIYKLHNIVSIEYKRDLFIPSGLLDQINDYIYSNADNDYLMDIDDTDSFTKTQYLFFSRHKNHFGEPLTYNSIYVAFRKVSLNCSIKFNFNDLRYLAVRELLGKDYTRRKADYILSFENYKIFENYI